VEWSSDEFAKSIIRLVEKADLENRIRIFGEDSLVPTNWADYFINILV